MGGKLFKIICLILSIHAASATINVTQFSQSSSSIAPSTSYSTTSSPLNQVPSSIGYEFLSPKPPSSYQVTENVIDIPDDRTLPPIVPNFGLVLPLNVANTSIPVNKVTKNDTGDENKQLKRTSFTYVHFMKEDTNTGTEVGGIKKIFRGIKDYVYNLKRGVVDGWHNYFHRDHKKDKEEGWNIKFLRNSRDENKSGDDFHHKFHRNFYSDESLDNDNHDVFEHEFEEY